MRCLIVVTGLIATSVSFAESAKPAYPPSKPEPVSDTLHGVTVIDPYRWLEKGDAPAVVDWTAKQNAFTREWLAKLPGREALRDRLDKMLDVGSLSIVVPRGKVVFYAERSARQNQPVLYVEDQSRRRTVIIDPNELAKDGTVTLDWWFPSPDGSKIAYGLSSSGSEQSTLRVRDVAVGKDMRDVIERTRACSLAWLPDGSGFYYTRYPKPGSVPAGQENYNRRVFRHKLGDDPADDELVFGKDREAADWPQLALSPDGRWLVVHVEKGWARNDVFFRDMFKNEEFASLVEEVPALFRVVPRDDAFYIQTNEKAPRYKVMTANPRQPARANWKQTVPESVRVLDEIRVVGDHLCCVYREGLETGIDFQALSKGVNSRGSLTIPAGEAITATASESNGSLLYVATQSYLKPTRVEAIKLGAIEKGQPAAPEWQLKSPVEYSEQIDVRLVSYPSKDGTKVPMTLIMKKGLKPDGKTPTVLYGYGGFNISLTPAFNPMRYLTICEYGGIMAIVNLRGGGEFGETWHEAGMLAKKQNVFDDFIAAAEFLIGEKYTDRDHLAIMGRSNGGLLVAAAITQRPDLFKAAICGVPLTDMLRYHRFLIGKLWVPEFGSPDEADEFKVLHAYSPYHRVKDGTRYPATLFTTAESDTRVDPMHARKMAALLQTASKGPEPILLRLEEKAGHGQGKPRAKLLDEEVDVWSFLLDQLGIKQ